MGQGTSTAGQRKHHHCFGRQQAGFSYRAARQAGNPRSRCSSLRQRSWPAFLRDFCQNRRERPGTFHSNCKEATTGPGRSAPCTTRPAPWCQSKPGERQHQHWRAVQLLSGGACNDLGIITGKRRGCLPRRLVPSCHPRQHRLATWRVTRGQGTVGATQLRLPVMLGTL